MGFLGCEVEVNKIAVASGEFVSGCRAKDKRYHDPTHIFESYCVTFRESRNHGVTHGNTAQFKRAGYALLALLAWSGDDGCHG